MKNLAFIPLLAVMLAACQPDPAPKPSEPVPPAPAPVTTKSYSLDSVTVSSTTVVCPGSNAALGVDCTSNAASFVGGNYDTGATISNPKRTGTYTLTGDVIRLNNLFEGTFKEDAGKATLYINKMSGSGSISGSLRLPVTYVYTVKSVTN